MTFGATPAGSLERIADSFANNPAVLRGDVRLSCAEFETWRTPDFAGKVDLSGQSSDHEGRRMIQEMKKKRKK